jgi:hypothetical protein
MTIRGLLDYLTYVYGQMWLAHGKVSDEDIEQFVHGAEAATRIAPAALDDKMDKTDALTMKKAEKVAQDISEGWAFLMSLEIV